MAEKTAPMSLGFGTSAWDEYVAAQKEAKEVLDNRSNRLFDPTMLAMAQGFLAPTKTGSFGESLGNVAAAVGPAQQAEDKRTMDMAKMRMELAQQGLQTSIQAEGAKQDADLLARMTGKPPAPVQGGAPAPSAGAPVSLPTAAPSAPPAGALAQAAPSATPSATPATQPAPLAQVAPQAAPQPAPQPDQPAPQAPVGTQLFPAQPSTWDQDETTYAMAQRRAGKPMGEIMKEIDEMRRKNIQVNQAGTSAVNLRTGKQFGFDPTPTKTFIHGFGSVEIPASYARMLGEAQDPDDYARIAKMIMFGPQSKAGTPPPTNSTPTGAAPAGAPAQRPTTAQAEANAAALKTESEEDAKSAAARTTAAKNLFAPAIETRIVAQSAKDLVNQEGGKLVMGIFEKPTVSAALAKMIDEGKFTPVGFRDAMVAANVAFSVPQKSNENDEQYTERKQQILDRYYQTATQVARAKFEASKLAQGQGAFSDGERRLFADTTLSMKDSVSTINKKADMLIERANFAQDLSREMSRARMNYDTFVDSPQGQKMIKDYEKRLSSIWTGKPVSSSKATTSPKSSGRPDLNAAREAVEKELR